MNEMLGNVNTSNALSAFEKMEEKGKVFGTNLFIEILFGMHFLPSSPILCEDFDSFR